MGASASSPTSESQEDEIPQASRKAAKRAARDIPDADTPLCHAAATPARAERKQREVEKVLLTLSTDEDRNDLTRQRRHRRSQTQWSLLALAKAIVRADEIADEKGKPSGMRDSISTESWKRLVETAFNRRQLCALLTALGTDKQSSLKGKLFSSAESKPPCSPQTETEKPDMLSKEQVEEVEEPVGVQVEEPVELSSSGR